MADTSLEFDRDVKVPLYASAGIPEVWLVDLEEDRIAVYREPGAGGYGSVRQLGRGDTLNPSPSPASNRHDTPAGTSPRRNAGRLTV